MKTNYLVTVDGLVVLKACTEDEANSWFEFHKSNARYNQTDEIVKIETDGEIIDTWNYSDEIEADKEYQGDMEGASHHYESKYED